jgi:pilus assembly protein CpaE
MPIYLFNAGGDRGGSASIESRLRSAIPEIKPVSSIESTLAQTSASGGIAYIVVVMSGIDQGGLAKLIDIAARHHHKMFLILVSPNISINDYKRLSQTDGADWVSADADFQEIVGIIARHQARVDGPNVGSAAERRPTVISFVPSAGGVGNTTLAIETGVQLAIGKAARHRKICLIDLDFQSSNVCDYIDIEPRLQIQEISADPDRLDAQLFEIFISRHASGLDVFAAPRSKFEYCDLEIAALDALMTMAADRYDLILVDHPVTWFAWTPKVIAASNGVIVTSANSVPGLRQVAETLADIRRLPQCLAQLVVAINRSQRRLLGGVARRHHVETALGNERIFYVAEEPMALESINTGSPMAMSKSYRAMGKDIAALAAFCDGLSPVHVDRK